MRSAITRNLPAPIRTILRQAYFGLRQLGDRLHDHYDSTGKSSEPAQRPDGSTDVPAPPPSLVAFVGGHDFKRVGEVYRQHLINLAHLRPEHSVLDVGCGVGRVAVALTRFLYPDSAYRGIDVTSSGIEWCRKQITSRYPNFRFEWCDVYNAVYNAAGKQRASTYRFPFDDYTFDLVFLTSVFTHMLPADFERYVSETSRVLKPGGRCLATFFILNDESKRLLETESNTQAFPHPMDGCRVADPSAPEAAVAYEEAAVRRCFEKFGFGEHAIYYGAWCGRSTFVDYQDMMVATRL